jgi:hypothetical protein
MTRACYIMGWCFAIAVMASACGGDSDAGSGPPGRLRVDPMLERAMSGICDGSTAGSQRQSRPGRRWDSDPFAVYAAKRWRKRNNSQQTGPSRARRARHPVRQRASRRARFRLKPAICSLAPHPHGSPSRGHEMASRVVLHIL